MYGLNMFSFLVFLLINFCALRVCKCSSQMQEKILRILCSFLLSLNIVKYISYPLLGKGIILPVEFSSSAYFTVPLILLFFRKKLSAWAAYAGLMAGFFYYITMIVFGGSIYNSYPPYDVYISMFCHGTLYFCGIVTASSREFSASSKRLIVGGVGIVTLFALLLRPLAEGQGRIFIYELIDGTYLKQLVSDTVISKIMPTYYIAMSALIILSAEIFIKLNRRLFIKYKNRRKQYSGNLKVSVV